MIRGIKFYFPFFAPVLVAMAFAAYMSLLDNAECAFLLGFNTSLLGLLIFCFLLPGTFSIGSLYLLYFSIKSRGHDSYPPSGIPWSGIFRRFSGRRAKIPKLMGYLLPVASAWMIWLGISSFVEIADGRTLSEMSAAIGSTCAH